MLNATSRDRVAEQFRDAADAARALAIQEDEEQADPPVSITRGKRALMLSALNGNSRLAVCDDGPGEAIRVVAEKLAAIGFDIHGPDRDEGWRLTIPNAQCTRCELVIEDDWSVTWDYRPLTGCDTDLAVMTGLVLRILGAEDAGRSQSATGAQPGTSLKGLVGRALDAHGLAVRMAVYTDLFFYSVAAELVVANPARPERGQVRVTDQGDITWERDYHDTAGSGAWDVAGAIVKVITDGIR